MYRVDRVKEDWAFQSWLTLDVLNDTIGICQSQTTSN